MEFEIKTFYIRDAEMFMLKELSYEEQLKYYNMKKTIIELRKQLEKYNKLFEQQQSDYYNSLNDKGLKKSEIDKRAARAFYPNQYINILDKIDFEIFDTFPEQDKLK
mmetsp:Transcript_17767/g.49173  ORF Transcript_17767/g.49173 Transcript_17767/m.49173 type:complete len:107 (+) Transcript_17767:36-356(+)